MEAYLNKGIKEIINQFPEVENILDKYGIGCAPCTTQVAPGEAPRAGRWRASGKVECGIHFDVEKWVRGPGPADSPT